MDPITLAEAGEALASAGICGRHQSHTRADSLNKVRALVAGDEDACFGLSGMTALDVAEVLGYLSELTGCSPDPDDASGYDVIEPARTLAGIVAAGRRLAEAARRGELLLAVTGHPTGLLEHHIRVVDAYRRAGGKLLLLREGEDLSRWRDRRIEVRYVGGVGVEADGANLKHTHASTAMELLLEGEPWPDLVLGDHGFAGAALERGLPTIAVMDINDPALAAAWGLGHDVTIVPMDDNRPPRLYEPSWRLITCLIAGWEPL